MVNATKGSLHIWQFSSPSNPCNNLSDGYYYFCCFVDEMTLGFGEVKNWTVWFQGPSAQTLCSPTTWVLIPWATGRLSRCWGQMKISGNERGGESTGRRLEDTAGLWGGWEGQRSPRASDVEATPGGLKCGLRKTHLTLSCLLLNASRVPGSALGSRCSRE